MSDGEIKVWRVNEYEWWAGTDLETYSQGPEHEFVPGVKLWGQRLCRECYKPFYFGIHKPSFGKDDRAIRKGE